MGQLYPSPGYSVTSSASVHPRNEYSMTAVAGDTTGTMFTVQGVIPASDPTYIDIFLNGVLQDFNVDYTLDNTGVAYVVTFTTAPAPTDVATAAY